VKRAYHTALGDGRLATVSPASLWTDGNGNEAFVHDLLAAPLPPAYERVDVVFSDIPWPAGFERFESRAGINGHHGPRSWADLVCTYIGEVRRLGKPLVFSTNRSQHPELPQPDVKLPGRLNGAHCRLWCYGIEVRPGDAEAVLRELAGRFDVIGDPMCGYGRAGRIFNEAGKSFVMSDYNSNCIGYIAEYAESWRS
jgi:hypothetical protein